jgi:hypothetical protein
MRNWLKALRLRKTRRNISRAKAIAQEDSALANATSHQRFSAGNRPVIRWIKGDGLDDEVTQAAIAQATRLFGREVDYCLCTVGLDAPRVRNILAFADQPVEWRPVTEEDNWELADFLTQAGCLPENYGYWWKWFPERVRPAGPEWILDGDMVVTGRPDWFEQWKSGKDGVRVSQDDRAAYEGMYGRYEPLVDTALKLYSGLISLPPGVRYMPAVAQVLDQIQLAPNHHGQRDMCEQGVIAAAFQSFNPKPIPLFEFPFARAFEDFLDFGLSENRNSVWGYHFGNAYRMANPHFHRLIAEGKIFSSRELPVEERHKWLGGLGEWGVPGWSLNRDCYRAIVQAARPFAGRTVLEIGTSRGHLTAALAELGCHVTTVDHADRGAAQNLTGLRVKVVQSDAAEFLVSNKRRYDLIVCDLHGNSEEDWEPLAQPLLKALSAQGSIILNNYRLYTDPEWAFERGVAQFVAHLPPNFEVQEIATAHPGVVKISQI